MARNGLDTDQAFELPKSNSQTPGRKLVDIAEAVIASNQLLRPTARD